MIEAIGVSDTSYTGQGAGEAAIAQFKQSMRRFTDAFAALPVATQATCPKCQKVTPARFHRVAQAFQPVQDADAQDGTSAQPGKAVLPKTQILLTWDCPDCGQSSQVHHDAIWTDLSSDFPGSPSQTFHGSRIRPILRRLPRTVQTLCPQCGAIVIGRYFVQNGRVMIEKSCPQHGYFRDCINSDALLYSKAAWWSFEEHAGQEFPQVTGGKNCPSDCGLCNQHLSSACLAQIDLTNRCNMNCPICFANANAAGYVCQPDYDQIIRQLQALRDLRPTPCTAIQFTGGEPTIHPDFLRILAAARDMGFSHIQIATNGLTLANLDFAKKCHDAGLHTLYLQFDGVGEDAYRATRATPGIWAKKLATIENCRKAGLKIALVPTILKGINSHQVGKIVQFALKNVDVISGISFQPVSFTGRIDQDEVASRRYTLGDLAHDIAAATGASPLRDMFPLSVVLPLSQILEALTGKPKVRPSCHTDCAFGTYFLVSPDGKPYAFPQVINIEGMFTEMNRIAARIRKRGHANWLDKWRTFRMFKRHFNEKAAPPGLTVKRLIRSMQGLVDKNLGRGAGEKLTYKTLLCAGMHFQDRYNYDVERTKRCVILYSTPGGIFPFCAYNCGPQYRPIVEKAFSSTAVSGMGVPPMIPNVADVPSARRAGVSPASNTAASATRPTPARAVAAGGAARTAKSLKTTPIAERLK